MQGFGEAGGEKMSLSNKISLFVKGDVAGVVLVRDIKKFIKELKI